MNRKIRAGVMLAAICSTMVLLVASCSHVSESDRDIEYLIGMSQANLTGC